MRRLIARIIAVFCALGMVVYAAAAQPIAVVTDLQGDVRSQRAGRANPEPLQHTALLFAGDRLLMGKDGGATLLQLHAPARSLGAGESVLLQPAAPSARAEVLPPDLFALIKKHLGAAGGSASETSNDGSRGADDVVVTALAPRYSLVLEEHPTFNWTPVKGAAGYRFTLYDARDNILWQKMTARETQVRYPANRKPLAPGEYVWEVLAQAGSQRGLDTVHFTIPTRQRAARARRVLERAARLVPNPNTTNLPRLVVCLEYRLYPQAETALKRATARSPQDQVLQALLMRLYQLTHRRDEREQARPITVDAK